MSTSEKIELFIFEEFTQGTPIGNIADKLVQLAEDETLLKSDVDAISEFLFKSELHEQLFEFSKQLLIKSRSPSWQYLAELINIYSKQFSDSAKIALINGAESFQELEQLALSKAFDTFDNRLSGVRERNKKQIQKNYENQRKTILNQIEVFKKQNSFEVETKLVQKLKKLFPRDNSLEMQDKELKARMALAFLTHRRQRKKTINKSISFIEHTPEEQEILEQLTKDVFSILKTYPNWGLDFAIFFISLHDYEHATEIILQTPTSPDRDWLLAELYLLNHKYLMGLEWAEYLEKQYQEDPETAFSLNYLRAQYFWGLGQKGLAINFLEAIVSFRPQFRLAASLLSMWKMEAQ